jgi:hypothetical protein
VNVNNINMPRAPAPFKGPLRKTLQEARRSSPGAA